MKIFRLSVMLLVLMLTGVLDGLIGVIPLLGAVWMFGSGLLGLVGLAQRLDRGKDFGLARVTLSR